MKATRDRWRCLAWSYPDPADSGPPVLNDLQRPTQRRVHPLSAFTSVCAIRPNMLQAGQLALQRSQQQLGAVAVRNISRMHEPPDDQALRIHQNMALAPIDFLRPIVASGAAHNRGLDRLAINNRRAGLGIAPSLHAYGPVELGVQSLPKPLHAPEAEIMIHRLPRGQVMRQQAPGTATA